MDCHLMVGDKVVCVDDREYSLHGRIRAVACLVEKEVYTIRSIDVHTFSSDKFGTVNDIGIKLIELARVTDNGHDEYFSHWRFRRVVDTTETVAEMARLMRQATKETVG